MFESSINAAVAFIIFNRPDTTLLVFNEIAKAKPKKLLVIADGPREHYRDDDEKVRCTREIINRVDWPCEVFKNYSDINMGCRKRISSGLSWVFDQVDEAIILEDDCLPDPDFFRYCDELLDRYRADKRVGIISGTNLVSGRMPPSVNSYSFTKHALIWGWATWSDRWTLYSDDLSCVERKDLSRTLNFYVDGSNTFKLYWMWIYTKARRKQLTTWDYQLSLASFMCGWNNILPNTNLIKNIGYGLGATHTTGSAPEIIIRSTLEGIDKKLVHPIEVKRDVCLDKLIDDYFLPSWFRVIASKTKDLFKG